MFFIVLFKLLYPSAIFYCCKELPLTFLVVYGVLVMMLTVFVCLKPFIYLYFLKNIFLDKIILG